MLIVEQYYCLRNAISWNMSMAQNTVDGGRQIIEKRARAHIGLTFQRVILKVDMRSNEPTIQ